jgi:hypothetical protein
MVLSREDIRTNGWDNFTFRCSSLGKIMTNPKGKSNKQKLEEAYSSFAEKAAAYEASANKETKAAQKLLTDMEKLSTEVKRLDLIKDEPHLSVGCKSFLADVYTFGMYGRKEVIASKYIEKGLQLEEDAITQYSRINKMFFEKNKRREYNDFIEGEIDFIHEDTIFDTKVNWSIFQFNRVSFNKLSELYKWQMTGYNWLFNTKEAKLIYSLLDTPEHLIEREFKKLMYEMFGSELNYNQSTELDKLIFDDACREIRKNHTYSDIPLKERIIEISVPRNEEDFELIKARVSDCRKYLNNFSKYKNSEDANLE